METQEIFTLEQMLSQNNIVLSSLNEKRISEYKEFTALDYIWVLYTWFNEMTKLCNEFNNVQMTELYGKLSKVIYEADLPLQQNSEFKIKEF